MCKCQTKRGKPGEKGDQGDIGPAGPGATQTKVRVDVTSIAASTDLVILASAASSGNMAYYGQVQISAAASIVVTLTPVVNGVANSASALVYVTTSKSGISKAVIPISDLQPIVSTNPFVIRVTLDDYAQSATASLRLNYNIQ